MAEQLVTRRAALRTAALMAAGLSGLAPADASVAEVRSADDVRTRRFTGRAPQGIDQWEYVAFEVGPGATRISVTCSFEEFSLPLLSNVLDLGLFGPQGWEVGNSAGFRGWSGGARREVAVTDSTATPGYLPGLFEGIWAVALGPIAVNPLGMAWEVVVSVEYGRVEYGTRTDDAGGKQDTPVEHRAERAFEPAPAPIRAHATGPRWFRGDLHVHSEHSDGTRTLDEVLSAARSGGLDFIASTEHNTRSANALWGAIVPDDFLVIAGEEVTTRYGHWLAVGLAWDGWLDWRYAPDDERFPLDAAEVRAGGGVVIAAHPGVPVPGSRWDFGFTDVDALEVWNSDWAWEDEGALAMWDALLAAGRKVVAVASSDSHRPEQPIGLPQTVVWAEELSSSALLEGIRAGRAYLAASAEITLDVRAETTGDSGGIGAELAAADGSDVSLIAQVTGAPEATMSLHSGEGEVSSVATDSSGVATLRWKATVPVGRFLRVEVRSAGAVLALSNPIWLR